MKRSILIIEKDVDKANQLRRILSKLGFHVHHNDSLIASKALMLSFHPDFVICQMSSESDKDVLDITQLLFNKAIPFVAIMSDNVNTLYQNVKECKPKAIYTGRVDLIGLQYLLESYDFEGAEQVYEKKILYVKQGTKYRMIPYCDIKYFIANANGVTIITSDEEVVLSSSLKSIMSRVDEDKFIRIHRNYMVNVNMISKYEAAQSLLYLDDIELPTGRVYKSEVSKVFKRLASAKG